MFRQAGGDGTPLGAIAAAQANFGDRIRELERLIRLAASGHQCDFCVAEDGTCGLHRTAPAVPAVESTYIFYACSPFTADAPQAEGVSARPAGAWSVDFLTLADTSWT